MSRWFEIRWLWIVEIVLLALILKSLNEVIFMAFLEILVIVVMLSIFLPVIGVFFETWWSEYGKGWWKKKKEQRKVKKIIKDMSTSPPV